jgi:cell cycle checkpoint protein
LVGHVFLDTSLFSSYVFRHESNVVDGTSSENELAGALFMVNLDALLETLQIFGIADSKDRWASRDTGGSISGAISRGGHANAFDSHILGMSGICKLTYQGEGAALCIVLEESGVTTTCELNTYEPDNLISIPFQADAIAHKVITRAEWLHDAIKELSAASPSKLTIVCSPDVPYFQLSASGPHGSASVEFNKDPQLLETFQVRRKVTNTYKYSMVKGATRAMAMASKVSIRGDEQGVLSLQFMIEVEDGKVTFVDFRFIPYIAEDDEEAKEEDYGGGLDGF